MFFISQLTMEYKHYYSYVAYPSKVVLEDPLYKSCKNICSVNKVLNNVDNPKTGKLRVQINPCKISKL